MFKTQSVLKIAFCAAAASLFLAACQSQNPPASAVSPTSTLAPTATTRPARNLTICMGEEPRSLYLYGGGGLAARTVLETVYDGPIDTLNYSYSPVILEQVPTIENGGAVLQSVTVQSGDKIINDAGAVASLVPNVRYRPAGCTDSSCVASYASGAVQMDQLVVTFRLKSGLRWSDGKPLTADDSLYSYELASSPNTPTPAGMQRALLGTQSYKATDTNTIQWTGLPGNLDPSYSLRFWVPLPRHAWGSISAADLLTADTSTRMPLGWGPYIIQTWETGKSIQLVKNPYYFRAEEGLPKFDTVQIRFISAEGELGLSAVLSGECDLVDQTVRLDDQIPMLLDLEKQKLIQAAVTTGTTWEHLDFNLDSVPGYGQPYLKDIRLHQAVAYCLNRQKLVETALGGITIVPDTYVPPQHPFANPDVVKYPYDPVKGKALLDQIGWKDADGVSATPRTASGVTGVANGTPLLLNIVTVDTALRHETINQFSADLADCGISLQAEYTDNSLFVSAEDGKVFGRRYEVTEFGWISGVEPSCDLYTTAEIPAAGNNWKGSNVTGFSNPAFDQACDLTHRVLRDSPAYKQNHFLAQAIFAKDLPSIPLFLTVRIAAAKPNFSGLVLDPTASSGLWNIELFDLVAGN
jgi:peptide/nickel transport system substrate-binding protein